MQSPFHYLKRKTIKALAAGARSGALALEKTRIPDRRLKHSITYHLLLNLALRERGRYREAARKLEEALRLNPDSDRLHLKLAEVYRENIEVGKAHAHLENAERLKPGGSTIRKLVFETEHQLYAEGSRTLERALAMPPEFLLSNIHSLDRISVHYPEHAGGFSRLRDQMISMLRDGSHDSKSALTKAVGHAIAMRRLGLAIELGRRPAGLTSSMRARLAQLEENLGARASALDLAWDNETAADPMALVRGEPHRISGLDATALKIVELFIPAAIFDYPGNEKETHRTIRAAFYHIIRILLDRDDLAVVPRMQLSWRYGFPKTRGARVISYHTSAPADPLRLHVQESPLAGYCSLDHAGFAGFATSAEDHSEIIDFVAGIPDSVLEENRRALHDQYVLGNVSKYRQLEVADAPLVPGSYVFVALQVSTDVVAKLGWMSGMDLLAGVVEHYRGTGTRVVVKSHPFCRAIHVAETLERLEAAGEIIRARGSIHPLIRDARLVLTVNSGVGLESLMHGKTVIVAGACDYSYGAIPVKSRGELAKTLADEPAVPPRRIREMLYYYARRLAVPAGDSGRIRSRLDDWLR